MARNSNSSTDNEVGYELNQDSISTGKGRPTPTRREKEEARKRPLVSNDRAEARRQSKAALATEREKQRIGMANGVEKYMPVRDRGVQRRYVRDYIDARTSIGEFLIPIMVVVLILTVFPQPEVQVGAFALLWLFFIAAVIDTVIVGFIIRKKLKAKYGEDNVETGLRWYAAMRALQLRLMRLPKPQVKRRQYPS
ncbi:hypothetical protein HD599_001286 [Conyzicola lurida]|uniref:DUF3043 domain-containing protein n=1 Tax=Conyzicola lurida TaxID=1172621 RepID=A0A841AMV3_9MICO|nr:hypothetical protein [Conyzicola lurida]